MLRRCAGLFVIGAALLLATALPPVDRAEAQGARYHVTGFRDVRFGMTEPEVRAAARAEFNVDDGDMTLTGSPLDGTTLLIVHVPNLEPGLGAGRVVYCFGYSTRRLIQVNVIWGEDTHPLPDDPKVIAAGARLQRHFLGFGWKSGSARAGIPIGDNSILLFGGEDDASGAVLLVIDGIRYDLPVNGGIVSSPQPQTLPKLTIKYIADRYDPDVRRIDRRNY